MEMSDDQHRPSPTIRKESRPRRVTAPRHVLIVEYAKARAREIKAMEEAASAINGTRRAFQTLPRHLRRRAMSHNTYRLPYRLRNYERNVSAKKTVSVNRRKNRYRPVITREHSRRQMRVKWLETHIWQAKRMKMKDMWGYRLAEHPADKSERACFKALSHICTMHDASYISSVEITGSIQGIVERLEQITGEGTHRRLLSPLCKAGQRHIGLYLYEKGQYPRGAIGPVQAHWIPAAASAGEGERRLWLWVHAAILERTVKVLGELMEGEGRTVTRIGDDLVHLQYNGGSVQSVLKHVVRSRDEMWNGLMDCHSPAELPPNCIFTICAQDPRYHLHTHITPHYSQQWESAAETKQEVFRHAAKVAREWPANACREDCALFSAAGREESRRKETECEVNTRRATAVDIPDGVPIMFMNGFLPMSAHGLTSLATSSQTTVATPNTITGWSVVMPKSWAMAFWRASSYAGARAIGQREQRGFCIEHGFPFFPTDAPDTPVGLEKEAEMASALQEKWTRKPPAKRVNHEKLRVSAPFKPDWESVVGDEKDAGAPFVIRSAGWTEDLSLSVRGQESAMDIVEDNDANGGLLGCIISLPQRGTAAYNAMVCAPSAADIEACTSNRERFSLQVGVKKSMPENKRKIIGYVTAGKQSFRTGHGSALCFVSARALQGMKPMPSSSHRGAGLRSRKWMVLVRNPTSLRYNVGFLELSPGSLPLP